MPLNNHLEPDNEIAYQFFMEVKSYVAHSFYKMGKQSEMEFLTLEHSHNFVEPAGFAKFINS